MEVQVSDLVKTVAEIVVRIFGGNPLIINDRVVVRQCGFCGSWNTEIEYPSEGLPEHWAFCRCHNCPVGEPFVLGESEMLCETAQSAEPDARNGATTT